MTTINLEDIYIPPPDYDTDCSVISSGTFPPADYDNQVGNPIDLRISNDTNSSWRSRFPRRRGIRDYDNVGCQHLRNSNDSAATGSSFASVCPIHSGGSQGGRNQQTSVPVNFVGARSFVGCQHLRNSNDSAATGSGFASVCPIHSGGSQGGRNQQTSVPVNFVGARAFHPQYSSAHLPSNPLQSPRTGYDELNWDDEKSKQRCSMKKIFIYFIFVIILFGISGITALSTIILQNTNEVESLVNGFPEMFKGQDEEIKNVNDTVLNTVQFFNDTLNSINIDLKKFYNESNYKLMEEMKEMFDVLRTELNETKEMVDGIKTNLYETKEMVDGLKTKLNEYQTTCSFSAKYGGKSDGRCHNVTVGQCVSDCYNICDGDYQSCSTCSGYVSCANYYLWDRPCPGHLVWDDSVKRCEVTSNCNIKETTTADIM